MTQTLRIDIQNLERKHNAPDISECDPLGSNQQYTSTTHQAPVVVACASECDSAVIGLCQDAGYLTNRDLGEVLGREHRVLGAPVAAIMLVTEAALARVFPQLFANVDPVPLGAEHSAHQLHLALVLEREADNRYREGQVCPWLFICRRRSHDAASYVFAMQNSNVEPMPTDICLFKVRLKDTITTRHGSRLWGYECGVVYTFDCIYTCVGVTFLHVCILDVAARVNTTIMLLNP